MPFYEYQCQACGAQVEVLQKITDAPQKKCPECGKSRLVKLVSAPVFRLKGAGWYETDFKTDKDKKRNLVESEKGESKSEEKSDSKVEAKSEAKAESKSETRDTGKSDAKASANSTPKSSSRAVKPARPAKPTKPAPPARKKARR